jgi:hypothetical protein
MADRPLHGQATPIAELSDADLGAFCDEHLGEAALAAAIEPINRWVESQRQDPDWSRVADRMNEYLGAWSAPPWTAEEANTLAMALALAQEGG